MPPDIVNFHLLCSFKRSIKLADISGFLKCFNDNVFLFRFLLTSVSAAIQHGLSNSNVLCLILVLLHKQREREKKHVAMTRKRAEAY